jgi:hypothetical protein
MEYLILAVSDLVERNLIKMYRFSGDMYNLLHDAVKLVEKIPNEEAVTFFVLDKQVAVNLYLNLVKHIDVKTLVTLEQKYEFVWVKNREETRRDIEDIYDNELEETEVFKVSEKLLDQRVYTVVIKTGSSFDKEWGVSFFYSVDENTIYDFIFGKVKTCKADVLRGIQTLKEAVIKLRNILMSI